MPQPKRKEERRTWCVYCGDYNECQDHLIPVAYNSGNRAIDRGKTVDCCTLCNRLAGDFVAFSVREKAIHLESAYQRKFAKLLQMPRWEQDELEELKGGLLNYIRRKQFLAHLIAEKLANLESVINGYPPRPIRKLYKLAGTDKLAAAIRADAAK